jgi:lipoprotein
VHDPGRIIVDLAVCVALGGGCLSDLAVLLRLMTTWDSSPARAVLPAHSPPPFGQDIHSRLTSVRVWLLTSTLVCDAL